ncbi:TPA: hypothetical protein N0F65_006191 [Lagenidium giganteum]|uniref:Uncharacterized protein n=1 Tax=Lagenidium giganteum TaxID=4803 RepID=A0AAV2Z7K3_9STRA|nr:TPA: hypothetical protein N0F65_006191 [Lagenidium giganteum]
MDRATEGNIEASKLLEDQAKHHEEEQIALAKELTARERAVGPKERALHARERALKARDKLFDKKAGFMSLNQEYLNERELQLKQRWRSTSRTSIYASLPLQEHPSIRLILI